MHKVTVRVPATTANLGSGFDCLGMALDIYNTVTVERSSEFGISIAGEGRDSLPQGRDNLVARAIARLFEEIKQPMPPLLITCHNNIPLKRGLGSSAAAAVGGLVAANALCDQPLPSSRLLDLAWELEGHPDQVAPALYGGCQVTVRDGDTSVVAPVPVPPNLKAVLLIPDFEMPTQESRTALPQQISRADAVYNVGRAALLATALATGALQYLRVATQDRLHQPSRSTRFPAMQAIFEAALGAGALAVFLSGGGSSVLAFAQGREEHIAEAMLKAAREVGAEGRTKITRPSLKGAHIDRD